MTIGSAGGIWQGEGDFTTPLTGLKLYNKSGQGTLAAYSDGSAALEIDGTRGIEIIPSSSYGQVRGYTFSHNAGLYAYSGGSLAGPTRWLGLRAPSDEAGTRIEMESLVSGTNESSIYIRARNYAGEAGIFLERTSLTESIGLVASTITLTAAQLNVGATQIGSWTSVSSFGSGWDNAGSPYAVAQYKKIGDLVMMRGMVIRNSGSGTLILTLPDGYRPTYDIGGFAVTATSAYAAISIGTNGQINLSVGSSSYLTFEGVIFSTV
jgi:hypothetical protein